MNIVDIISELRKEKVEVGHCKDEYIKILESIITDIYAKSKQFNHIHTDEIEEIIKGITN